MGAHSVMADGSGRRMQWAAIFDVAAIEGIPDEEVVKQIEELFRMLDTDETGTLVRSQLDDGFYDILGMQDYLPMGSEDFQIIDGQRQETVDEFMLQSEDGEYLDMTGFEIAMRARIYPDALDDELEDD